MYNIEEITNRILNDLKAVKDPDLNKDIVSLGFIKNISHQNNKISFDLELTTPACPVKDQLKAECEAIVLKIPGIKQVDIRMTSNVASRTQFGTSKVLPTVKNIIAVASGKGGVGKSTVAANLALALAKSGTKVGILDADIYGPSMPTMFGISQMPQITQEKKILPIEQYGLQIMSMGFLTPADKPVIWRGPMVHSIINQFLQQVLWGDLDYLVLDLPPGTGDAQLSLTQNCPISGAVIVSTPQDVSLIDARKGLKMFQEVKVPVLGIVENMSVFICPHCQHPTHIFRSGGVQKTCQEMGVNFLGHIPIDPEVVVGGDDGTPIVAKNPTSLAAQAFFAIAGEVARQISILNSQPVLSELTLEWKT